MTWELYTAARILAETPRETPIFDDSALANALNQAARDLGLDILEDEVKELIIGEIHKIINDSALEVLNLDLEVLDVTFYLPNPLTLIIEAVSLISTFATHELEYRRLFNAGSRANRYANTARHLQLLANQRGAELWDAIDAGEVIEIYGNSFLINGESVEISEDIGLFDPSYLRVVAQVYENYAGYAVSVVTALGEDTNTFTIDDILEGIINAGAEFVGTDALLGYLSTAEDGVREKKLLELLNSRLVDEVTAVFSEKIDAVYNSAASVLDQYGFCEDTQHPPPKTVDPNPGENVANDPPLPNHTPQVYRQFRPQKFWVGDDPKWINLSSYFSDPDGDMLKYKATSSDDRIVVATIEDNSVKTKPGEAGTAMVTVIAEDPGGLIKEQNFWVTVQQMESLTIPSLPVCDRTPQVREEIMKETDDNNCANVTEDELESIKSLSMLEEDINTLKQGDFDELRGLEELVLKGNSLETLPEDVFWYLGNLKKLSLRNNQFTILVEDTFDHLDSLTYLSLRGNRLTTLQQGAFNDLDALIELDLSDNQLTTLPTGVFENLFNLEELTLENNNITILSSGGFLGLSSLKDLELDGNSLHTIEAGAFNGLSTLTDLDFNNHPLHTIEAGAFSGLNSLTNLELGNTELSTLSRDVFSGLSSLDDLELYENPLHTIETGAFNGLSSLRCLDLSDAQLSTLSRDVFLGLSNLESLDLDGNSLKTIEVGAFNGLSSLTSLYLCENQLTMLRVVTFSGLNNLTHLSLDENQFATLPADIFSELSELRHLNLSENQFTTLPVGVFKGLSNLTYLNLQDNPGAPFTLTLELARTDNANQTALGPATVKVKLAEGAPFEMNVSLSVEGGALSASTATIEKGRTESEAITVTQSGIGPTTVNLEIAPTIPSNYSGIRMAVGNSLVLFTGDKGSSVVVSIAPSRVESPVIGEQLTLNLNIAGGEAVAGYQATVQFDASALRYVDSSKGDYLPADAFFTQTKVGENGVLLTSTSHAEESRGNGTLAKLIFEVVEVKTSILTLSEVILSDRAGETSFPLLENGQVVKHSQIPEDVNRDGVVNIQDLVLVASFFGQRYKKDADINGDNVVNIADLVLVANALSNAAAAPAAHSQVLDMLTAADLQQWLTQAQQLNLTDAPPQRGILFLENLLAALTPKETSLLPNYPNPFNPETWIPYQLAEPTDVTLTIYAANGAVVRTLELGHQPAGMYQSRSRAAYWDGRNGVGEPVASGLYFYTLTAGDFTATRKMLIQYLRQIIRV